MLKTNKRGKTTYFSQYIFRGVKLKCAKVLVVLDMHLICVIFLKVDFVTDNQPPVKDPLKYLTWHVLAKIWLKLFLFLQK